MNVIDKNYLLNYRSDNTTVDYTYNDELNNIIDIIQHDNELYLISRNDNNITIYSSYTNDKSFNNVSDYCTLNESNNIQRVYYGSSIKCAYVIVYVSETINKGTSNETQKYYYQLFTSTTGIFKKYELTDEDIDTSQITINDNITYRDITSSSFNTNTNYSTINNIYDIGLIFKKNNITYLRYFNKSNNITNTIDVRNIIGIKEFDNNTSIIDITDASVSNFNYSYNYIDNVLYEFFSCIHTITDNENNSYATMCYFFKQQGSNQIRFFTLILLTKEDTTEPINYTNLIFNNHPIILSDHAEVYIITFLYDNTTSTKTINDIININIDYYNYTSDHINYTLLTKLYNELINPSSTNTYRTNINYKTINDNTTSTIYAINFVNGINIYNIKLSNNLSFVYFINLLVSTNTITDEDGNINEVSTIDYSFYTIIDNQISLITNNSTSTFKPNIIHYFLIDEDYVINNITVFNDDIKINDNVIVNNNLTIMKNVDINGGLSINSNGRVYITSGGSIKFSNEDIKKDDNVYLFVNKESNNLVSNRIFESDLSSEILKKYHIIDVKKCTYNSNYYYVALSMNGIYLFDINYELLDKQLLSSNQSYYRLLVNHSLLIGLLYDSVDKISYGSSLISITEHQNTHNIILSITYYLNKSINDIYLAVDKNNNYIIQQSIDNNIILYQIDNCEFNITNKKIFYTLTNVSKIIQAYYINDIFIILYVNNNNQTLIQFCTEYNNKESIKDKHLLLSNNSIYTNIITFTPIVKNNTLKIYSCYNQTITNDNLTITGFINVYIINNFDMQYVMNEINSTESDKIVINETDNKLNITIDDMIYDVYYNNKVITYTYKYHTIFGFINITTNNKSITNKIIGTLYFNNNTYNNQTVIIDPSQTISFTIDDTNYTLKYYTVICKEVIEYYNSEDVIIVIKENNKIINISCNSLINDYDLDLQKEILTYAINDTMFDVQYNIDTNTYTYTVYDYKTT